MTSTYLTAAAATAGRTRGRSHLGKASLATLAAALLLTACGSSSNGSSKTAAAATGSASASCQPAADLHTVHDGELTVAAYQAPPYIGVTNGQLTGIDGEILTEVAAINCLKPVAMELPFPSVIPAVTSGRADVASGDFYASETRKKSTNLSEPAYADRLAIVSKGGAIATIADLKGKRVGSLQGDTWNIVLKTLSNFKEYQSQQAVYTDFKVGRLDAVIDAVASAPAQLKLNGITGAEAVVPPADQRVDSTVKPPLNTFPHKLGNDSMTKAINTALDKMRENGKLSEILTKYGYSADAQKLPSPYYLIGS